MESTIIHIGYHKSASTFLQQQVFPKLPVNYVFFAGENRKYLDMMESSGSIDTKTIREWVKREISNKYPAGKHPVTVLSHEELSGHPHGYKIIVPEVTALNLRETFPNSKILIIIRNQLDYMTSLYTYRVAIKGYETRSFSRFLKEEGEKGLYDHLEYHRLISHYRQLFGNENVTILPMELLLQSPDEFYKQLLDILDVQTKGLKNIRPANVSTKSLTILNLWRPINYCFGQTLHLVNLISGTRQGNSPRYRSWFYKQKRILTTAFNTLSANSKQIDIRELPVSRSLIERFAKSNYHLLGLVKSDLVQFGYPFENQ